MKIKMSSWNWFQVAVIVFLLVLAIEIVMTATSDGDLTSYNYYIEINTPNGIIEGPGRVINWGSSGLTLVEIDGIQYKVGSQNVFARKMEDN